MRILRWKAEAATYAVLLVGLGYLYWLTFFFGKSPVRGYPGAAFFPRLILYFSIAATIAALVAAISNGIGSKIGNAAPRFEFKLREFTLTVLAIGAFIGLLPVLGFEITSFGLMLVLLAVRFDGWAQALAGALLTTLVFYFVFVLMLGVPLPLRFLPSYVSLF